MTGNTLESGPHERLIEQIDAIFAPWNRSDRPGYVVGVAYRGDVLYRKGLGMANLALGLANTAATRMRIGSVSKHFTCLCAFLLEEEGKLDVSAPARRYLPELAPQPASGEPTVLQLMQHTSGLRDTIGLGLLGSGLGAQQGADMPLARARAQRGVNFAAGERLMYNNGAYHLLSLIVERAAGMPFETFLAQRIFEPLGMRDTASYPDDDAQHAGVATLHLPLATGGYARCAFPSRRILGEGAIVSTVDDMLRWLAHLRSDKRVGSAHTWQRMLAAPQFAGGEVSPYAAGLIVNRYRGVDVIQHSGGVIGGACQMLTVPAHALDIVYMTNAAAGLDMLELCNRVIDAVLGDAELGAPPRVPERGEAWPGLAGWYASEDNKDIYEITEFGEMLNLREMDGPPAPLFVTDGANGKRLAIEPSVFGSFAFDVPGPANDVAELHASLCGRSLQLKRVRAQASDIESCLAALAGCFVSEEMGAIATIRREGDAWRLDMQVSDGHASYTLEALAGRIVRFTPATPLTPLSGLLVLDPYESSVPRFWLGNYNNRRVEFVRAAHAEGAQAIAALLEMR
ncbi:serine hydrolase domain-containing protein [Paraburkholderia unamae]|uniref:CubicO group peptidase (Beta-lactamase class C family) n=1 Tax=Paraburkholderia unamae TaxID=219649 RepID=A0ABX5K684_9BURK|nr:serine hydrolase domain-containing protein [Paraburkholderia unamae]PVX61039.1 CubicO group peptidase (beta-lactamase class C family) [Paraburkholderia unamae]